MLRKIADFLNPKSIERPYGLSAERVAQLRSLRSHPNWKTYVDLLDNLIMMYAEALLASNNHAEQNFYRGTVVGIRKCGLIIDEILKAEEPNEKNARTDATQHKRAEQRALATWGSSLYHRPGQRGVEGTVRGP